MIPAAITEILSDHANLGFAWLREAADFVMANKDWATLIKDRFSVDEVAIVNKWREDTLSNKETIWKMR